MLCEICGKEFKKTHWYEPYDKCCCDDCFSEKLWRLRESDYRTGVIDYIIIDGIAYTDGGRKPKGTPFLGHAGREFRVKMNDGREITTNNLWCGGEIPENHRVVMKDNAVFMKEER